MTTTRADDLLAAPLGLQLLDLISERQPDSLTDDDLSDLLVQLHFHISRYNTDYEEHVASLKSKAAQLRRLGEWLPTRMPQWWDDVDRVQQVWVGRSPNAPIESELVADFSPFGAETAKPRAAFWTSTRIPTFISPWLESPEKVWRGPEMIWAVTVSEAARVAEIHSPALWSELVRSYPHAESGYIFSPLVDRHRSEDTARLDPDWSKIAQDWDAVHLSAGGWLTAEDVPLESDGVTTELRGWEMESTVWLRWAFNSVEMIDSGR